MDLQIQLVERHPVLEVPVEPVRLLDEEFPAGGCLSEEVEHFAEAGPASLLGGLHVHELTNYRQTTSLGIVAQ